MTFPDQLPAVSTSSTRVVRRRVKPPSARLAVALIALIASAHVVSAQSTGDYMIGPQDVLTIQVYDQADLGGKYSVEADGTFSFPLIGRVKAGGQTLRAFEQDLKSKLADGYFRNPQVTVAIEQYRSQRVFVMRKALRARDRSITRTGGLPAAVKVIWRALPLGLSAAIGSLQINLPRYTIAAYLGPAALAVFSALAYVPTLSNLIANAIAQAALPVLARDLRVSRAAYVARLRTLVRSGVALGAVSVVTVALVGRALVTLIYSAEIARHVDVLIVLMIATAVTYSFLFLGSALTARLRFSTQCFISLAGLVTVASSVVPLVSHFGLRGAAYALCAGAVVEGSAYVAATSHDLRADTRPRSKTPGLMDECTGEAA